MDQFKTVKKGYEKNTVDNYINSLKSNYELQIGEYRVNISDLHVKIDKLEAELNKYKEKEETIGKSIEKAIEKAEEIEYTSKIRFALEGERIKVFKEKWLSYVNKYIDSIHPNHIIEMNNYLNQVEKEAFKLFQQEFHVKDYLDENSRFIEE